MQSDKNSGKRILVTGTAGFIGYHLVRSLLRADYDVYGLDNINDYYEADLKYARLAETGIARDQNCLVGNRAPPRWKGSLECLQLLQIAAGV